MAVLLIGGVGGYLWFFRYNPCDVKEVEQAAVFLNTQLRSFDHSFQFATTVTINGLSRPVLELQQIFMDTQGLAVPVCLEKAKGHLLQYMDVLIRAFHAAMNEESNAAIRSLLDQSGSYYERFNKDLDSVQKCAPYCAPWN